MSDPTTITWAAVGMAAVSNVATWLIIVKKKNNKSNTVEPGTGEICGKHGERIMGVEKDMEHYKEDIKEIKDDIKEIKAAVIK